MRHEWSDQVILERIMRHYFLCILIGMAAFPAYGQRFEIGVKGGIPITQAFETYPVSTIDFAEHDTFATRRYTVGPTVGIQLSHGLGIEVDALYSRLGFDANGRASGIAVSHTRTTAHSWEFPVLAKFLFQRLPAIKPFFDGGMAFRVTGGVLSTTAAGIEGSPTTFAYSTSTTDPFLADRPGTEVWWA